MADTNGALRIGDCVRGDRIMLLQHGRSRFLVGRRGHPLLGPDYMELVCESAAPGSEVWRGLRVWTPYCFECYPWAHRNRKAVRAALETRV